MSKLGKARSLYLRGFKSNYIKRRTGMSIQTLLKTLLADGIKYTKDDVINNQVEYITTRYTNDDVVQAYYDISNNHDDIYVASKRKEIFALGCCFGQHAKVFSRILGDDAYKSLKAEVWKKKQTVVVQDKYGVDNVFRKEVFDDVVSDEAVREGRFKRNKTMVERYGVEEPLQNEDIYRRMRQTLKKTNLKLYGVEHVMQNPDIARRATIKRQETMRKRYGAGNSVQIEKFRNAIFASRKRNGTLNTSRPEKLLGVLLCEHFGEDDVLHNVVVDDRYPYHVDYYIKSQDLFIELNGDRCHNDHWFDPASKKDAQTLDSWVQQMLRLEKANGKPSRYRKYIKTWTDTDLRKRESAKSNNLNYLVFWDGSCHQKNKKQTPNLSDAIEWFDDACPNPHDWYTENTY